MNIFKDNRGVSLLELIVATSIFVTVILMATNIFNAVVKNQRIAIAAQNTQEGLRFALEVMSKEIRNAKGHYTGSVCPVAGQINKIYNSSALSNVYFENSENSCVTYSLDNGRILIDRDGESYYITPQNINITSLKFDIVDDLANTFRTTQAKVTIKVEAKMETVREEESQPIILQTTVSSRYYGT